MSRLVFRGDIIKNFGKFLPTPIIEKIGIYDNYLKVKVSIFLQDQDFTPDTNDNLNRAVTFNNILNDLHFYLAYVIDKDQINQFINKEENIFKAINGDDKLWINYITHTGADTAYYMYYENAIKLGTSGADWTQEDTIYDESYNIVYKYTQEVDLYYGRQTGSAETHLATLGDPNHVGYRDLTLFCFSSLVNIASFAGLTSTTISLPIKNSAGLQETSRYYTAHMPETPLVFVDKETSDITYESVIKDGRVDLTPRAIYLDSAGAQYSDIPIQSLGGTFYKADTVTHEQVTNTFGELISEYDGVTVTEEMANIMDQVVYILSTYSKSPKLLKELQTLFEVWPTRVAATAAGKLFVKYSTSLAAFDKALQNSDSLKIELTTNYKLIDYRTPFGGEYDPSTFSGNTLEYNPASEPFWAGDSSYIYPNFYMSRETYYLSAVYNPAGVLYSGKEYCINRGYFFFDFEKALRADTELSRIIDISKLEFWFGRELSNYGLKVSELSLQRFGAPNELAALVRKADLLAQMVGTFDTEAAYPRITEETLTSGGDGLETDFKWGNTEEFMYDPDQAAGVIIEDGETSSGVDFSYVIPRSFDVASTADAQDYRLMCFYFQDYFDGDQAYKGGDLGVTLPRPFEWYQATVSLKDQTIKTVDALGTALQSVWSNLRAYKAEAADACSYNEEAGYFNTFFADAMAERYKDNPNEAPWIRAASAYYIYLDLLEDHFGGDRTAISEATAHKSEQIGPEVGTLEQLEAFLHKVESLYRVYFTVNSGLLYAGLSSDYNPLSDTPPSFDLRYQIQTDFLPNISFVDPDRAPESEIAIPIYDYKKYAWNDEKKQATTRNNTREQFKEFMFGKWRRILDVCPTCKGSTMSAVDATQHDPAHGESPYTAHAVYKGYSWLEWDTVFALVKTDYLKLGWKGYYDNIHYQLKWQEVESGEAETAVKDFAQWAWGSSTARDTNEEKGFDWKEEIANKFGLTKKDNQQRITKEELVDEAIEYYESIED